MGKKKKASKWKKPHWPIMDFIKEKMSSWYLMHPALNLNVSSLFFSFKKKHRIPELWNVCFCSASVALMEVADRVFPEEECISLSVALLTVNCLSLNSAQQVFKPHPHPLRIPHLLCPDISSRSPSHFHFPPHQPSHSQFYSAPWLRGLLSPS